jgi:hypothetical protein
MKHEILLAQGRLYLERDEPVPLTLLADADSNGLMLTEFGQPQTISNYCEEESKIGSSKEELYDGQVYSSLCLPDEAGHSI